MAPSVHLVLLLSILLSLAETPASAPAHRGRGGWTLNSAGYLLGPVAIQGRKQESALDLLDLWRAIDGLPYSHPKQASKRSLVETFAKPKIGGLGLLSKDLPRRETS